MTPETLKEDLDGLVAGLAEANGGTWRVDVQSYGVAMETPDDAIVVQALILVAAQGKTTLDGMYTAAQAARGETIYKDSCVGCHGDDLSGGGQAPPERPGPGSWRIRGFATCKRRLRLHLRAGTQRW